MTYHQFFLHSLGFQITLTDRYGNRYQIKNRVLLSFKLNNCRGSLIPDRYASIPDIVTRIGNRAFWLCRSLKVIILPEGITHIGRAAFAHCSGLVHINLPKGLTSIDSSAFVGCGRLCVISFPEGLKSIGDHAFENCSALQSVIFPESLQFIGGWAFLYCSRLKFVKLPRSLSMMGNYVFRNCIKLRTVVVHSHLISLGKSVFSLCRITNIYLPSMTSKDFAQRLLSGADLRSDQQLSIQKESMLSLSLIKDLAHDYVTQSEQVRAQIARNVLIQIFVEEGIPYLNSQGGRLDHQAPIRLPREIVYMIADHIFYDIPARDYRLSGLNESSIFNQDYEKALMNTTVLDHLCQTKSSGII